MANFWARVVGSLAAEDDCFRMRIALLLKLKQKHNILRNQIHCEDRNTQTASKQNVTGTQSLGDTLTLMKRNENLLKPVENSNGDVFCNGVHNKPLGANRNRILYEE